MEMTIKEQKKTVEKIIGIGQRKLSESFEKSKSKIIDTNAWGWWVEIVWGVGGDLKSVQIMPTKLIYANLIFLSNKIHFAC